jgi:hypothetical protein
MTSACSEACQPGMWVRAIPPTPITPTFNVFVMNSLLKIIKNEELRNKNFVEAD